MARIRERDLVVGLLVAVVVVGAVCAPAHVAWARQDLLAAMASDPGDGVLGDPGDGFGGDRTDGEDVDGVGAPGRDHRAGDPGDGDGALLVAGDPGDGGECFLRGKWRSAVVRWLVSVITGASR